MKIAEYVNFRQNTPFPLILGTKVRAMVLSEYSYHVTAVKLLHELVSMEHFDSEGREIDIAQYLCEERKAQSLEAVPDRFLPGKAASFSIVGQSELGMRGQRDKCVLVESVHGATNTYEVNDAEWLG